MNKPSIAENKRICRTRYRGKRGAIAFGVVLALILVMLGVGFMVLVLYMGGQHETKNAVDAGALNIGKQIIDNASTRLGLGFLDEKQRIFYDVLADDPYKLIPDLKVKASLRNINRVWGKALLIGINADAAEKDGNAGSATANAKSAIEGAEALSNDLQKDVVDSKNWRGWFDDIAKLNSVRMLGQDAAMKPAVSAPGTTSMSSSRSRTPAAPRRCRWPSTSASSTARASSRTATSAGLSSCRARSCGRNRCARS